MPKLIDEDFLATFVAITGVGVTPGDGNNAVAINVQMPASTDLLKALGVYSDVYHQGHRINFAFLGLDLASKAAQVKFNVPNLPNGQVELHIDEATNFELVMLKDSGLFLRCKLRTSNQVTAVAGYLEAITSTEANMHFRPLEVQKNLPLVPEAAKDAAKAVASATGKGSKPKAVN
jgi:hypothetical protein